MRSIAPWRTLRPKCRPPHSHQPKPALAYHRWYWAGLVASLPPRHQRRPNLVVHRRQPWMHWPWQKKPCRALNLPIQPQRRLRLPQPRQSQPVARPRSCQRPPHHRAMASYLARHHRHRSQILASSHRCRPVCQILATYRVRVLIYHQKTWAPFCRQPHQPAARMAHYQRRHQASQATRASSIFLARSLLRRLHTRLYQQRGPDATLPACATGPVCCINSGIIGPDDTWHYSDR